MWREKEKKKENWGRTLIVIEDIFSSYNRHMYSLCFMCHHPGLFTVSSGKELSENHP